MTEDRFTQILREINERLKEVWSAIDELRTNSVSSKLDHAERIARLEVQMSVNKWLIGLVVTQFIGLAFWALRK